MNLLYNAGHHEHPAFWNKFGMPLFVDLQIVVPQVIVNYVKPLWSCPMVIKFLHYKLHTLSKNFLNAVTFFSGCPLLLT